MRHYLFLSIGLLLLLNGCSEDSSTATPPITTFDAIVKGNVVDQDDNAVSRADILIAFNTGSCGSNGSTVAARTDVNNRGEFRRIINQPAPVTIRCLEFLISSPDDNFESKLIREEVQMELKSEEPLPTKEITIRVQVN